MISRQWKGIVRSGRDDDYIRHLKSETFPRLAKMRGFVGASILRRAVADGTEFQVVTLWSTLEAIKAFAGADVEAAVVPPNAQPLLLRYDTRVLHYEVVAT